MPAVSLQKVIWDKWSWQLPSQALGWQLSEKARVRLSSQRHGMAALSDSTEPGYRKVCWAVSVHPQRPCHTMLHSRSPRGPAQANLGLAMDRDSSDWGEGRGGEGRVPVLERAVWE